MGAAPPTGAPKGPAPSAGDAASSSGGGGSGAQQQGGDGGGDAEAEEDAEARAMAEMMGFAAFDSTAGKEVSDPRCKMEAVKKKEPRRYRQYMNRRGGFNRPLDEM